MPDNPQDVLNAAANQLVDRYIVYDFLAKQKLAAGKNEIRLALEAFRSELARIDQTLEQYVASKGQRLEELEFELAWRIAWNRYLKRELSEEYLEKFYIDHLREFDGSEMRVAHLLIKPDESGLLDGAASRAQQIYEELKAGRLDWGAAVKRNSAAPTRDSAGEIGWISFHQPMPPDFSRAAFKLEVG